MINLSIWFGKAIELKSTESMGENHFNGIGCCFSFFMNGSAILRSHLSTGAAVCYRALIGDTARCVACSHHLGYFSLLHTTEGVM